MSGEAEDDLSLLRRVASGDRAAFDALVERHWAPMHRYASALARDSAAAEDALQETFVSVWKNAASFRGGDVSPRAWLYAIGRNAVHRQLRRRAGEPRPDEVTPIDELGVAAGWGQPTALDGALRAIEQRDCVESALSDLTDAERELLVLVDVEGLSLEEAASALDVGVAALKSRLHRARLRFMGELERKGCADAR